MHELPILPVDVFNNLIFHAYTLGVRVYLCMGRELLLVPMLILRPDFGVWLGKLPVIRTDFGGWLGKLPRIRKSPVYCSHSDRADYASWFSGFVVTCIIYLWPRAFFSSLCISSDFLVACMDRSLHYCCIFFVS